MNSINDIFKIQNDNELCRVTFINPKNQFVFPFDVTIHVNGSKLLAKSQILDGFTVFERVTKQVNEIQFDFTLRDICDQAKTQLNTIVPVSKYPYQNKYIVAINWLNYFIQNVWNKDEVLQVDNILLNAIGIKQIIVESYSINTIRGNVDMPMTLKCYEDYYSVKNQGSTLIM